MVVMDPDEIVFLDQRRDACGKAFVDPLIALAGLAFVLSQVEAEMEQRPQRGIGIAVVILVDIAVREVDRRGGDAVVALRGYFALVLLALRARPAEPDALVIAQRRVQRAGKPALRTRGAACLGHRDPVRDDDEFAYRTSLQGLDNRPAQLITPTSE